MCLEGNKDVEVLKDSNKHLLKDTGLDIPTTKQSTCIGKKYKKVNISLPNKMKPAQSKPNVFPNDI